MTGEQTPAAPPAPSRRQRFLAFAAENPWLAFVMAGFAAAGFLVLAFFVFIYQPDQQDQKLQATQSETAVTAANEAKVLADQALQASRDDNRDLCTFLTTTANALDETRATQPTTPAGVQFRSTFKQVADAAREAAASPDCPK